MVVIGIGTGLPWGLMDGLSVSVVPKERAGMATGIFSTTRVAGEGLALAMVGAALAGIVAARLAPGATAATGGSLRTPIDLAAQRLATGDLNGASALLPDVPVALLRQHYADAFHLLTYGLAAITVLAALAALRYLGFGEGQGASVTTAASCDEAR
jgi:hypothetical protein